jgi:fibronectin-binding autotransporter adhesin
VNGTLTLTGANTYTGGTTIVSGAVAATPLVKTTHGSGTGLGPVLVTGGTFGGGSNIAGAVTIGDGTGAAAYLAPGINGPGTLAIHNRLTFRADATYNCEFDTTKSKADQVIANKVTIESGALFAFVGKGSQALPVGTVFTVIKTMASDPIGGAFANLADGSAFTANGNNFQVSYEGGDGNDLTLTVGP